jgi:hypothetical protein
MDPAQLKQAQTTSGLISPTPLRFIAVSSFGHVSWPGLLLLCAMGSDISMPCSAAISTIRFMSGWSSKTSGLPSSSAGLPTSSKKRSYKPPGAWVTSILPTPSPTPPVGVQGALGHVEEGARARPYGAVLHMELVLTFEHVERFVLAMVDVRRPAPGWVATSKSEYAPPVLWLGIL